MSILSIIEELANEPKKNGKLDILKQHKDNELLKIVFKMAYDKVEYTFNMKDVDLQDQNPDLKVSLEAALEDISYTLNEQKLRGHKAVEFMKGIMSQLAEDDQTVVKRVINRDLRAGCGVGSINKTWKGLIQEVPQMLAQPMKEKTIKAIVYPAVAQEKADGTRCIVMIQNGVVTLFSRNGNEFDLPTLKGEFERLVSEHEGADNRMFDGELLYDDSDTEADRQTGNGIVGKSIKGTIKPEEEKRVFIKVWDTTAIESAKAGFCDVPYLTRLRGLNNMFGSVFESHYIDLIETHIVESLDEAKSVYQSYIEKGKEGIILKNSNAPWENKRSKNQVKFKEIIEIEMRIVGVYDHSKQPNKVGGFTVESACGSIRCNTGSGLMDKKENGHELDRSLLWEQRDEILDRVITMECNGAIERRNRKPEEPKYKLFLPIIKSFRHDKDKANTYEEIFG